uniref:ASCH domain-containing protein n=1 Tax=Kalanchoe fedtschenkoi TaxID=63787 RepID=A0A7N0U077_KALFE
MTKVDVRSCIEELLKSTLTSFVNGSLELDLGFPTSYCSHLLLADSADSVAATNSSGGDFDGVPAYPLYKRLAHALYESVTSGALYSGTEDNLLFQVDDGVKQREGAWGKLMSDSGSALINVLRKVDFELHVQEPFFSYLKDGLKVVEGRCARGDYNRMGPGAYLLLNQCVMLEVQGVHRYDSFSEMLGSEGLSRVLPGVQTVEEGVQVYRRFYTETEEKSFGVLAIQVQKPANQPVDFLATILSGLSYAGIQHLLGLTHTVGTIPEALPPPKSVLLASFTLSCNPNVTGSVLTHGARALAKHASRDSSRYWGTSVGNDSEKNRQALDVLNKLLARCCWLNIHIVPPHGEVFEIRVADGHGARWTKDGTQFIGFLEPYSEDGHTKGWKH